MVKTVLATMLLCGMAFGQAPAALKANEAMASSAMKRWPTGAIGTTNGPGHWGYEEGVLLDGIAAEWHRTGNRAKFDYIKTALDKYVTKEGTIQMDGSGRAFTTAEHQLDNIELGRTILLVYRETKDERYAKAAKFLVGQLALQPRAENGGYWHKTIYPNQMWLDGAFMAEPLRAEYAVAFHQPGDFDDVAKQFLLMYDHMRDPATGLLKHGWDVSKQMPWADRETGLSPEIWARALGWYCVALVDVLDSIPQGNPNRPKLVAVLKQLMPAVEKYQDPATGLWWQVMDKGSAKGNYTEASASAMFAYTLAKGARKGYLPASAAVNARKGWAGIQSKFVTANPDGTVSLTGTVKVGGLGGKPYRSGTYDYYIGEKVGDNDAKGIGAYLMAGSEMSQSR